MIVQFLPVKFTCLLALTRFTVTRHQIHAQCPGGNRVGDIVN